MVFANLLFAAFCPAYAVALWRDGQRGSAVFNAVAGALNVLAIFRHLLLESR